MRPIELVRAASELDALNWGVAETVERACAGSPVGGELAGLFRRRAGSAGSLNAFRSIASPEPVSEPARSPGGALCGVTVALKDLIDEAGSRTGAGTTAFSGRAGPSEIADADAAIVRLLRRQGALVVGRTNLDELGLGVTGINPHYGAVRNPYDRTRISGGSSSGSAVAVAAGLCLVGIGTDTGGSVRIPAALCGVVGLKPSFGVLDMTGVRPLAPSLDHLGIIARSVEDCEDVFRALTALPGTGARGASPSSFRVSSADRMVRPGLGFAAVRHAIERLGSAGAKIVAPASVPAPVEYMAVQRVIASYEAARLYRRELELSRSPFGPVADAYLREGLAVSPADLRSAVSARARIGATVDAALAGCEVLVTPAAEVVAPTILDAAPGGPYARSIRDSLVRNTCLFNLTGHPAIVVPIGTAAGLPVGVQMVAARGQDETLFAVARLLSQR
jgi:aspartyl-tRNA(Asn)/glutamyl-tRNA(Gln) amidotransferase subunit A